MNIFENLPKNHKIEEFLDLYKNKDIQIQRIVSPLGCHLSSDWYDQDKDEWVLLIQGSATIEFKDSILSLKVGDHILIPAHKKHMVTSTSATEDTIWLAIFS